MRTRKLVSRRQSYLISVTLWLVYRFSVFVLRHPIKGEGSSDEFGFDESLYNFVVVFFLNFVGIKM